MPTSSDNSARGRKVIEAHSLGKQYRIRHEGDGVSGLRDLFSKNAMRRSKSENVWALRNVSFDVCEGEVLGVLGQNGAGKSTLLKILSRITEPSEGTARVRGRLGCLLEVGTGFHEELTGRENVFLSGTILGMRKREIVKKFDEIVAFSEVEQFIDTPVKFYSNGMYLRLAFSVAAHLEPEILLVDEVLAVGDASFQKKCLGRVGDEAKEGKTVLFVSHNMGQLSRLCRNGLWLHRGECKKYGPIAEVIAAYQASLFSPDADTADGGRNEHGFISWKIANSSNGKPHTLTAEGPVLLEVDLSVARPVTYAYHGLILKSTDGKNIAGWGINGLSMAPGRYKIRYKIPHLPIRPGSYNWYASLWDGGEKVDCNYLIPELVIAHQEHSTLEGESAGVLNLPCDIDIKRSDT